MSYTNTFKKLVGESRHEAWTNESGFNSPYEWALARHLDSDVKMNLKSGYVPTAGVLGQREYSRQFDELLNLGQAVRGDYWQEHAGMTKVQCGFKDNRDKPMYAAALDLLETAIEKRGYKISRRSSGSTIALNASLAKHMQKMHSEWLRAMKKAGATVVEAKAGSADESFADVFSKHRLAEGNPSSLSDWNATMKLALERNIEPEETDYTYNKFDLAKVTAALTPFSNLIFTPARDFAPVLYVSGPTETLGALAKVAEKKLGAYEAELTSKSRLRISWE